MASQTQQIADTIFNMKRKLLRQNDEDSDEGETPFAQQGYSLKRKATYTRFWKPGSSAEPPYKKRVEHAGYQRYVVHFNPPRYDPDGDIVERIDEYESGKEDELSDVEEDPYADIILEDLLVPLKSAAHLPNHPTMAQAYTSKHLTNLTNEAGVISRKEQITLSKAKALCTKLQGDAFWVPDALVPTSEQLNPWSASSSLQEQIEDGVRTQRSSISKQPPDVTVQEADHKADTNPIPAQDGDITNTSQDEDVNMSNGDHNVAHLNGSSALEAPEPQEGTEVAVNGTAHQENGQNEGAQDGDVEMQSPAEDGSDTASQQTSHRMTTRARAQAEVSKTPSLPSSPSSVAHPIHPLYVFPTDHLPDRDFGLPSAEAEETRFLLLAFVQKQEEIARAASDLYLGMLEGDRMKHDVFKWTKAEAHVGEMSDGEEWYDKEEWGLDQDLGKGRDEEEEDTQVQGKKTTRRQGRRTDKEDR